MFILGQGAMCAEDAESIFNFSLMIYNKLKKNNEWNGFNVLQNFASRVGALDLGFFNKKNVISRSLRKKIYSGKFNTLFLVSADELDFEKIPKNTFNILSQIYNENIQDSIMVCGSIDSSDSLILRNLNQIVKYK